jgi:hypothetical protein
MLNCDSSTAAAATSPPTARAFVVALVAALAFGGMQVPSAGVRAQDGTDLARLFPRELPVRAPEGPARLALPADVLTHARPDLADVRLFDASGYEQPYLVDSGARPAGAPAAPVPVTATPVAAARRVVGADYQEVFDLPPPPAPAQATPSRVELVLGARAPEFVRDVQVVALLPGGAPGPVLADTSVFRFQAPVRERLRVPLGELPPGAVGVRVTLGEQLAARTGVRLLWPLGWTRDALTPTFAYARVYEQRDPPTLAIPLEPAPEDPARARSLEQGVTELRLALPRGIRPDRLRLESSSANFVREVSVRDERRAIGGGAVYRIDALRDRGGEELEIPVDFARGDVLSVRVVDGDSPPLEGLRVVAVVRRPSIVYLSGGDAILRYGGGRIRAPRYDIAAIAGVGLADRLLAGGAVAEAEAGDPRDNPRFDAAPALGFLARPGVAVDLTKYTHLADVEVPDAREGIVRLRVPAEALAAARADLRDLRVVDADGRQWPYVASKAERAPVELPLQVGPVERDGRKSRYALRLPVARATVASVRLDVDARFVERGYTLRGLDDDGEEVVVSSGVLSRDPASSAPVALGGSFTRVSDLVLEVDDGDDAPLVVRGARLVMELPELLVAAPAGRYRLVAGFDAADAPDYELSRARALVDAVPYGEARVGAVVANPAHRAPSFFERTGWQTTALWAALAVAVLVLGGLTLRLARTESDGDGSGAPRDGSGGGAPGGGAPGPEARGADAGGDGAGGGGAGARA